MSPYLLTIFVSSIGLGTVITLSSHSWMLAWIGLEINTLAMIPIMTMNYHPRAIEAATKYFLTQATASALILFSSTINAWMTGQWMIESQTPTTSIMFTLAIAMKLGVAPFHFWLPEVLQGVNLKTGLILSTWQKFAPMALLLQMSHMTNTTLMLSLGTLSMLFGGLAGINQTQLRKIMAFSSISHLGWTLSVLPFSPNLALLNFVIYVIMTTSLFSIFIYMNTKTLTDLNMAWTKSTILTPLTLLLFLSTAGLPPLTGFLPKLLIAQELIKNNYILLTFFMLLTTLFSLYFYLRLAYVVTLLVPPDLTFWPLSWKPVKPFYGTPFIILSLFLLPVAPLITTLC